MSIIENTTFTLKNTGSTTQFRLQDSGSNYVGFKPPSVVTSNAVWQLPAADGTSGQVLSTNGSAVLSWTTPSSASGTVTSVSLSLPSFITVSGSPITTTGTLTGTLASQSANLFFASPNGSAGAPTFRAIVSADISTLSFLQNGNSFAGLATLGTSDNNALRFITNNTEVVRLTATGRLGLGTSTPSSILSASGQSAQIFNLERNVTADTAGNSLTILSSGATVGATNRAGGNLILSSGISTGTGTSSILVNVYKAGSSGTADNSSTNIVSFNGTDLSLNPHGTSAGNAGELRFLELAANGTHYVSFKAADSIAANIVWTLPAADGTSGQVLSTNGTATLSWTNSVASIGAIGAGNINGASVSGSVLTLHFANDTQSGILKSTAIQRFNADKTIGPTSSSITAAFGNNNLILGGDTNTISAGTNSVLVAGSTNTISSAGAANIALGGSTNSVLGGSNGGILGSDSSNLGASTGNFNYLIVARTTTISSTGAYNTILGGVGNTLAGSASNSLLLAAGSVSQTITSPTAGMYLCANLISKQTVFTTPAGASISAAELLTCALNLTTSSTYTLPTAAAIFSALGSPTVTHRVDVEVKNSTNDPAATYTLNIGTNGTVTGGVLGLIKGAVRLSVFSVSSSAYYVEVSNILPAGSTGQIQFNSGGTLLGASANLFWDNSLSRLGLSTATPSSILSASGQSAQVFGLERNVTGNTAGNSLTIQASGATLAATDKAGGNLILSSGISTGTGNSSVLIQTYKAGSTGTSDNSAVNIVTFNPTNLSLNPHGTSAGNTCELRFLELAANGTSYVSFKSADSLAANVTWTLPAADGTSGQILRTDGSGVLSWVNNAAGVGTVTSVAISLPSIFTVSGSPITSSGTLTASLASQSTNLFFAAPSGGSGSPTFRAIVSADINSVAFIQGGNAFGALGTLGLSDSNDLRIITNNLNRIHITSAGNVGIANSSPGSTLDVKGTLRLTGATSGYMGFISPATVTTPVTFTLPNGDGSPGTCLVTNGSSVLSWSNPTAANTPLSGITNATSTNTTNNSNNAQSWNWSLTAANNGINIGESSASSGTGYILTLGTLATSTAKPLLITARGTTILNTTAVGAIILGDSATLNTPITLQSGTGDILIGTDTVAKTITIGNVTGATALNLSTGTGNLDVITPTVNLTASSGVTSLLFAGSSGGSVGFKAPATVTTPVTWQLPALDGTSGQILRTNGSGVLSFVTSSAGTVSSVGLSMPSDFSVGSSPVTSSGTLTVTYASQTANKFLASPNGGSGTPTFRAIVAGDINTLAHIQGGNAFSALSTIGTSDANDLRLITNGSSRVYITSAGLMGINNTSPGSTLDVKGTLRLTGSASGYLGFISPATVTTPVTFILPNGDGTANQALKTDGAGNLSWGNLGSVTSVALALPSFITVSGSPVTSSGTLTGVLASQSANLFFASPNGSSGSPTFRAIASADISSLAFVQNGNAFGALASLGTSDSFDLKLITNNLDRLHITSSGNVGINNTTPGSTLDIKGTLRLTGATSGYLGFASPATVTTPVTFTLPNGDGSSGQALTTNGSAVLAWTSLTSGTVTSVGLSLPSFITVSGSPVTSSGTLTGTLASQTANTFFAAPNGSSGSPTFRAIASADINTIAFVQNGNAFGALNTLGSTDANSLRFITNSIETARITAAGLFGIGIVVPTTKLHVSQSSAGSNTATIENLAGGATNHVLLVKGGDNSTTGSKLITFQRPDATEIGNITQNAAATIAYNTTSDKTLKENIEESTIGLSTLRKLEVKEYNFIKDQNKTRMQGLLAQDVYQIYKDPVTVGNENSAWQIDYSKFSPILIKSVQDLDKEVQELKQLVQMQKETIKFLMNKLESTS